jgi:hypothetical protein
MTRLALVIFSLFAVGACARPRYIEPTPHGAVVTSAKVGLYTKEVMTKKDPDTLVADDATICRVSPDQYASTRVHSMVYCNWQ